MAKTNTPKEDTYTTKRVSIVTTPLQRSSSSSKDAKYVNCFVEEIENKVDKTKKYFIKSRAGLSTAYSNTAGVSRGIYYWIVSGVGYVFSVIGNTVYVNGVSKLTLATSTGNVGFCEHLNATSQVTLILVDGTNGYVWTDPNTPVSIIPNTWASNTAYTTSTRIKPTVSNSYYYECTTAGTSRGYRATAVAINAAGSGYTDGDVLTVVGGTGTSATTLTVNFVGGSGEVASVSVNNPGNYTVVPTNPVSVTGGTGTGATFNLTTAIVEPTWPTTIGSTVTDNTVVWTCKGGDFPSPHIPTPVVLDGYLFVAKANTADIYNSDLNTPLYWTPGDFITAEMYPDKLVALSKNNNYLYGIGFGSVEYFYDAANATGSPLGRQAPSVQQFGCAAQGTVIQTEKEVIFVGETGNGGHTVWTIDGFKEKEIGIPMVKSALLAEGSSLSSATAYCIRVSQHKLYVLCLSSRTLVYDFDTELWHEWDSGSSGGTLFLANRGADGPNGSAYLLDRSSGKTYTIDATKLDDAGTNFQVLIVTQKLDFDTINRKTMSRFTIIGDVPDSTLVDQAVTIDWSDDDYTTWSTPRTLKFTGDLPMIAQLGTFRRRAFRIKYALPHLFRIEGIEVDINKGTK